MYVPWTPVVGGSKDWKCYRVELSETPYYSADNAYAAAYTLDVSVHHYSDVRILSGMRPYVAAGRKIRSAPLHTFAAPRGLMTDVVCEYVSWRDPYDGASEGTIKVPSYLSLKSLF